MGIFDWLGNFYGERPRPVPSERDRTPVTTVAEPTSLVESGWIMPTFRGRDICEWESDIARLKRDGQLGEALELATGCMDAMVQTAVRNPANAMEHYVIQVAVIQRKMKAYGEEIQTTTTWLAMGIPAPRHDHRLDLQKRLAKAQELLARQEGRDSSAHHAEWKRLVELGKKAKVPATEYSSNTQPQSRSGRTAARPASAYSSRGRSSRLVPVLDDLMSPEFVAVDFETANRRGGVSACQIALVKVRNGVVVDRYATLLKPPPDWDSFEFTYLHGISQRDVRRSPSWTDVVDPVKSFVAGLPVYAHNAQFDSRVWRELDGFFTTVSLPERFYCTYRLAERVIPGLPNYKLPTVTSHCSPGFQLQHHQADSDAEACALIVSSIQSDRAIVQRL